MLNFACHTWPYQSYHVVFLQADQSQPWLRLFKVTKLHLDVVGWVRAPMLRWGVCFPPWFDAFLCYSWNWSRYRESSMGRGRSLSLITGAIEQACSLTEFCLVRTLDHSLRFLLPFLGLDVLKMSCSTTWSLNFWPFCKVSRALRILTQSLFPSFQLAVFPLPGASWTATRLLAGEDVGDVSRLDGEAASGKSKW